VPPVSGRQILLSTHALHRQSFNSFDVRVISIAMPLTLLVACVCSIKYVHTNVRAAALAMLAGVWLLGGLCMTIGASFSGGGFVGPGGLRGAFFVIAMSLLPIYTFIMSTYDGSLGALLLVTIVLLLASVLPLKMSRPKPGV